MVKIRLHGGFFVARLFPFKCCRRFTSFAICLPYPFGAGNCNTVLPRFLAFSGFITVKSQRCAFPFDNIATFTLQFKKGYFRFSSTYDKKFLHNISRVRNLCNRWVFFVSIWQNCNADAEKLSLQCLQCKREKPQISHNVSRVRNLCNRWVFFVNLAKLQCRCGKILFAMFAVQERKTTNFCTTSAVYAICATVGCLLCQFGKIAMQMRKFFSLRCLPCKREKLQNPLFMAFICVKSTHLTVNMV